jgi:hypothetical protein
LNSVSLKKFILHYSPIIMNKTVLESIHSAMNKNQLGDTCIRVAGSAGAFVAASSVAEAAIVYFPVEPGVSISGYYRFETFGLINLQDGSYTLGTRSQPAFRLRTDSYGASFIVYGMQQVFDPTSFLAPRLEFGAIIDGSRGFLSGAGSSNALADTGATSWNNADPNNTYYLGVRIIASGSDFNYGWIGLNYDSVKNEITVTGFAFESDLNTPIAAGAIPEPGTKALFFGLAVLAYAAARRRKIGGAPESLLQLAAGARGVKALRKSRQMS